MPGSTPSLSFPPGLELTSTRDKTPASSCLGRPSSDRTQPPSFGRPCTPSACARVSLLLLEKLSSLRRPF